MKKFILSLLPGLLLVSSVFAQDYDSCVDQCGLDYDSNLQCDLIPCYDSCLNSEICEDEYSCMESCEGDTDCEDECYIGSDCEEYEMSCQESCDSNNESCIEEVEGQYNSCVLQCENPGTDEPDVPVIPDNPGGDSGISGLIPGGVSSLSGTFLQFTSTVSEFIPYIVYISLGILGSIIGFYAIRWLINWIRKVVFSSFK